MGLKFPNFWALRVKNWQYSIVHRTFSCYNKYTITHFAYFFPALALVNFFLTYGCTSYTKYRIFQILGLCHSNNPPCSALTMLVGWQKGYPLSLRSMSRRRGRRRLHELTPCRSIQSVPLCRRQAEIERLQPFSTRFASVYRFCVASLWEDPE